MPRCSFTLGATPAEDGSLGRLARRKLGRKPTPTASTFDFGKRIHRRTRLIVTDTRDLLLAVPVHPAKRPGRQSCGNLAGVPATKLRIEWYLAIAPEKSGCAASHADPDRRCQRHTGPPMGDPRDVARRLPKHLAFLCTWHAAWLSLSDPRRVMERSFKSLRHWISPSSAFKESSS